VFSRKIFAICVPILDWVFTFGMQMLLNQEDEEMSDVDEMSFLNLALAPAS
jgi:hypothetical protein